VNALAEKTTMQPAIPGKVFNLAGNDYVLAPLNLRQLEELGPTIDAVGNVSSMHEVAKIAATLVLASLSRNYSDMTIERVQEIVDVGNMRAAIEAVLAVSGYRGAAPGEI
jgi:hypothetical protein